jgi:hypothetical protein
MTSYENQKHINSFKINELVADIFSTKDSKFPKSWRLPGVKKKTPTAHVCKCLILRVGPVGHDPTTP